MSDNLSELVRERMIALRLSDDRKQIQFITENFMFSFECDGGYSDCWINHISGIDALLGHKINKIEAMSMNDIIEAAPEGIDKLVYSYKFYTNYGCCELELRNSYIHGFYGGCLRFIPGSRYDFFETITKDF